MADGEVRCPVMTVLGHQTRRESPLNLPNSRIDANFFAAMHTATQAESKPDALDWHPTIA